MSGQAITETVRGVLESYEKALAALEPIRQGIAGVTRAEIKSGNGVGAVQALLAATDNGNNIVGKYGHDIACRIVSSAILGVCDLIEQNPRTDVTAQIPVNELRRLLVVIVSSFRAVDHVRASADSPELGFKSIFEVVTNNIALDPRSTGEIRNFKALVDIFSESSLLVTRLGVQLGRGVVKIPETDTEMLAHAKACFQYVLDVRNQGRVVVYPEYHDLVNLERQICGDRSETDLPEDKKKYGLSEDVIQRIDSCLTSLEELGVQPDQVLPMARFIEDLGFDSLHVVQLVMKLEEEFGFEIADDDSEKFQRVGDVYRFFAEHLRQRAGA